MLNQLFCVKIQMLDLATTTIFAENKIHVNIKHVSLQCPQPNHLAVSAFQDGAAVPKVNSVSHAPNVAKKEIPKILLMMVSAFLVIMVLATLIMDFMMN